MTHRSTPKTAIRKETMDKGMGWYGFSSGKKCPRRVADSTLEVGWTAWVFGEDTGKAGSRARTATIWYNVYSDTFEESKPERRSFTRKCPGCDSQLDQSWCSQYCSRSCMYNDIA